MNLPTCHLSRWFLTQRLPSPYAAPELAFRCLGGYCPEREDSILTSQLIARTTAGHIQTENSIYILGAPAPDYEAQFPAALERLLATLPESQP